MILIFKHGDPKSRNSLYLNKKYVHIDSYQAVVKFDSVILVWYETKEGDVRKK